ncbi:MAG: class I SAM-dependent methyltransferase [Candidatus Neomarinimicrobiota bacterium]
MVDYSFPKNMVGEISERCLRCYEEQYWFGENFLFNYINENNVNGKRVLEIGCAEAGLLKFYNDKGAKCSGLELSKIRFNNAISLNDKNKLHLFQANICEPSSYKKHIKQNYDLIIIRDVIEHISNKSIALSNMFSILKPGGKLFISFPPKYCPYAGHQQTIPNILGKIPYIYLMPNFLYERYLKLIKCSSKKIEYLMQTKKTRISNFEMLRLLSETGFKVLKRSNWFIRPAYSFRFKLPKLRNPFSWAPVLDEIFCNGMLILVERTKV